MIPWNGLISFPMYSKIPTSVSIGGLVTSALPSAGFSLPNNHVLGGSKLWRGFSAPETGRGVSDAGVTALSSLSFLSSGWSSVEAVGVASPEAMAADEDGEGGRDRLVELEEPESIVEEDGMSVWRDRRRGKTNRNSPSLKGLTFHQVPFNKSRIENSAGDLLALLSES
jgi:hypothetical protein